MGNLWVESEGIDVVLNEYFLLVLIKEINCVGEIIEGSDESREKSMNKKEIFFIIVT